MLLKRDKIGKLKKVENVFFTTSLIKKFLIIIFPFFIIFIINFRFLFTLFNPSWGDSVPPPLIKIPLNTLFYPWQNTFVGSFGIQYLPHVIASYIIQVVSPTFFQFIYFFFVFFILFVTFLDIFKNFLRKDSVFNFSVLIYANILTLIIYFSNVFLVNYIQGNPDIYYPYLLCIPCVAYLYIFVKEKNFLPLIKLSLLITIAIWFSGLGFYYMGILILPYFLFFLANFRKELSKRHLIYLVLFSIFLLLDNASAIFITLKPILNAIGNATSTNIQIGLFEDIHSLYQSINPLNLFYFAGNVGDFTWLSFNIPGGYIFEHNIFFPFLIIPFIFLLRYIFLSEKKINPILFGLFFIFLSFFSILILWDTPIFINISQHIPLTPLFRNPKKLILMLYVSYIMMILFLSLLIGRKTYLKFILLTLLINFLVVIPLISDGYNGLFTAHEISLKTYNQNYLDPVENFNSKINFPERFLLIKNKLTSININNNYRVIVVPNIGQTQYQNLQYLFNLFSVNVNSSIWGNVNSENIMSILYSSIIDKQKKDLSSLLKIANVKYLIVDRKASYYSGGQEKNPRIRSYYGDFTIGDPESFNKILKTKDDLKLIHSDDNFYLYENLNYKDSLFYFPEKICSDADSNISCDLFVQNYNAYPNYNPAKININNIKQTSPTDFNFTVYATTSGKFPIFFNQLFDNDWEIYSRGISVSNHQIGNYFGNTWDVYIPRAGKYIYNIRYKSQPLFSLLVIISIASIFTNLILIVYLSKKK